MGTGGIMSEVRGHDSLVLTDPQSGLRYCRRRRRCPRRYTWTHKRHPEPVIGERVNHYDSMESLQPFFVCTDGTVGVERFIPPYPMALKILSQRTRV